MKVTLISLCYCACRLHTEVTPCHPSLHPFSVTSYPAFTVTSRLLHVHTLIGQRRPFFSEIFRKTGGKLKCFSLIQKCQFVSVSATCLNLEYNAVERTHSKETDVGLKPFLDISFILKLKTGSTPPVFVTWLRFCGSQDLLKPFSFPHRRFFPL